MTDAVNDPALALRRELRARSLHALNSPLGAILAQAELIQLLASRDRLTEAVDAATNIANDCERYARMLREAFATMEEIDTWHDGTCVVEDALASGTAMLAEAGARLEVLGGDVVLPWARSMASTFFTRCFDNALGHGARRIEVTAECDDAGIRLVVRDDGDGLQGLGPEAALRAFVSSTPTVRTGLGLWIARAMAHRVGGELDLPSAADGFIVECRFPAGWQR